MKRLAQCSTKAQRKRCSGWMPAEVRHLWKASPACSVRSQKQLNTSVSKEASVWLLLLRSRRSQSSYALRRSPWGRPLDRQRPDRRRLQKPDRPPPETNGSPMESSPCQPYAGAFLHHVQRSLENILGRRINHSTEIRDRTHGDLCSAYRWTQQTHVIQCRAHGSDLQM